MTTDRRRKATRRLVGPFLARTRTLLAELEPIAMGRAAGDERQAVVDELNRIESTARGLGLEDVAAAADEVASRVAEGGAAHWVVLRTALAAASPNAVLAPIWVVPPGHTAPRWHRMVGQVAEPLRVCESVEVMRAEPMDVAPALIAVPGHDLVAAREDFEGLACAWVAWAERADVALRRTAAEAGAVRVLDPEDRIERLFEVARGDVDRRAATDLAVIGLGDDHASVTGALAGVGLECAHPGDDAETMGWLARGAVDAVIVGPQGQASAAAFLRAIPGAEGLPMFGWRRPLPGADFADDSDEETFARSVAGCLDRAQQRAPGLDRATRLPLRAAILAEADQWVGHVVRRPQPLGCAVLRRVAQAPVGAVERRRAGSVRVAISDEISRHVRRVDRVGLMGPDVWLVLAPGLRAAGLEQRMRVVAERIRERLASTGTPMDFRVGVADDLPSVDRLVERALSAAVGA